MIELLLSALNHSPTNLPGQDVFTAKAVCSRFRMMVGCAKALKDASGMALQDSQKPCRCVSRSFSSNCLLYSESL